MKININKWRNVKKFCISLLMAAVLSVGCEPASEIDEPAPEPEPTPTPIPTPTPTPSVENEIFISAVRATDSTIAFGWTMDKNNIQYIADAIPNSGYDYSQDIEYNYTIALYKSEKCTPESLVVRVENIDGSQAFDIANRPPRFVVTGLKPKTDYYAMVYNESNGKKTYTPTKVSTTASLVNRSSVVRSNGKVGDLILFENFEKLLYGGDLSIRAAGISRSDRGTMTQIAPIEGNISLSDTGYILAHAGIEMGLFSTLQYILDEIGISDWSWIGGKEDATGGSVCARAGYIKIGTANNRSFICTPQLKAIPNGQKATIKVQFRAAPFGAYTKSNVEPVEKAMAVNLLADAKQSSTYNMTYTDIIDSTTFTLQGDTTADWQDYSVTLRGATSTSAVAIGGALEATQSNRMLVDDIRIYIESLEPQTDISGIITDQNGSGVAGVVVSDGYTVTTTNNNGRYVIPINDKANFIFYTTPAQYEIAVAEDGYPLFYKIIASSDNFDFKLSKRIDKQRRWDLVVMADPQTSEKKMTRHYFNTYTAPDIKHTINSENYMSGTMADGKPFAYGMVLGDVVNNMPVSHMQLVREDMNYENTAVGWFTVPGNHDWYNSAKDTNPSLNNYHSVFGPSVYSFDRGDVHIVGMNNTITGAGIGAGDYDMGFTADEYAWLVKDLELVDKDKCVVLCVHIPFFNGNPDLRHNKYYKETLTLLSRFKNAYIFSGHGHYSYNWNFPEYNNVREFNHATVHGTTWSLKICADGTPAGYYIYTFEDNDCVRTLYKALGTNSTKEARNAIRMYLGSDSYQAKMAFGYGKSSRTVYANVFHGYTSTTLTDSSPVNGVWQIELYYKGEKVGDMVQVKYTDAEYGRQDKPADYQEDLSSCVVDTKYLRNDVDWWFLSRAVYGDSSFKNANGYTWKGSTSSSYQKKIKHLFAGTLPEDVTVSSRDVMVRATSPTGEVFELNEFTPFSHNDSFAWEKME